MITVEKGDSGPAAMRGIKPHKAPAPYFIPEGAVIVLPATIVVRLLLQDRRGMSAKYASRIC